jgi:hypothetical protein
MVMDVFISFSFGLILLFGFNFFAGEVAGGSNGQSARTSPRVSQSNFHVA